MRRKSGNPELCTGGRGETPMACTSSQSPMAVSASKAKRPSPGNRTRPLKTSEPPDADPHVRWCGRGTAVLLTAAPIPIRVGPKTVAGWGQGPITYGLRNCIL